MIHTCKGCGAHSYVPDTGTSEELLRGLSTSSVKPLEQVGRDIPDVPIPLTASWKAFLATYGDGEVPISGSLLEVGERISIVVSLETLLGIGSSQHIPAKDRAAQFSIDLEPRGTDADIGYFGAAPIQSWSNGDVAYNNGRWEILGVTISSRDTTTIDPQQPSRRLRVTLNQVLSYETPQQRERFMASAIYGEYGSDTPYDMAPEVTGKDAVGGDIRGMSVYVPVNARGSTFFDPIGEQERYYSVLHCYVTQLYSGNSPPEPAVKDLAVQWWMRMYPPGK